MWYAVLYVVIFLSLFLNIHFSETIHSSLPKGCKIDLRFHKKKSDISGTIFCDLLDNLMFYMYT